MQHCKDKKVVVIYRSFLEDIDVIQQSSWKWIIILKDTLNIPVFIAHVNAMPDLSPI